MAKEKKKKHWIKIVAPKQFGNKVLGETLCRDSKNLVGRTLSVSLAGLIGDFRKQNLNLSFVINDVGENEANTELYKYNMSGSHLKRLVRKSKNKIDDSFICESKDKIKIKIKSVMLTRMKTSRSVLTSLRKESRDIITRYIQGITFIDFVKDVISGKIQSKLKYDLKRIYPLSLFELRVVEKVK